MNDVQLMIRIIGSPFVDQEEVVDFITPQKVDSLFDISFKNRVGLLMLQRLKDRKFPLTETGKENYQKLLARRNETDRVLIKLTRKLDEVCRGGWVLFKTVKPFPSTPNDTDWFPFDESKHKELCDHLLASGFDYLEKAPLQTTLIDSSGKGLAASDKRGGVWYIDCYKVPGADYFKYLDPAKMRRYLDFIDIESVSVPVLSPSAELIAICFHNVFPERTYSLESFYLILYYLQKIEADDRMEEFLFAVADNYISKALYANLIVTSELHKEFFGFVPDVVQMLLGRFNYKFEDNKVAEKKFVLPYNFSNKCFWLCFFQKLKDPISLRSLFVQAFHMLNPVFCAGVVRILYRRLSGTGIYEQQ